MMVHGAIIKNLLMLICGTFSIVWMYLIDFRGQHLPMLIFFWFMYPFRDDGTACNVDTSGLPEILDFKNWSCK